MTELNDSCVQCGNKASKELGCVTCGKNLCEDCAKMCNGCERPLCEECVIECPECGEDSCEDCLVSCAICGESYCASCSETILGTCGECRETFCQNCGDVVDEDSIGAEKFGHESICEKCNY